MAKRKILVGYEFHDAFFAIIDLINAGALDNTYKTDGKLIFDSTYEYELSSVENRTLEQDQKFEMTLKGASWFEGFRGGSPSDDSAIWSDLVQQISIEFHKRYSVVEYEEESLSRDKQQEINRKADKAIKNFFKVFYPTAADPVLSFINKKSNYDNIYSIYMRMNLSGGTGATVPVLSKVYFIQTDDGFVPLQKETAMMIEETISNVVTNDKDEEIDVDENVINESLNVFEKLIQNVNDNISNYMFYSTAQDEQTVLKMVDKLRHENLSLECNNVDVLYISHIKLHRSSYEILLENEPRFRMDVSSNGQITIKCLNCSDDSILVNNSTVILNKSEDKTAIVLDFDQEDLGLSDELIERIKNESSVCDHNLIINCVKSLNCRRVRCKSQLFVLGEHQDTLICQNCTHKEKVFKVGNVRYLTKDLRYAMDSHSLVLESETGKCGLCGRLFLKSNLNKTKRCETCAKMINASATPEGIKLFKKYKSLLPLSKRIFKDKKQCFCHIDNYGDVYFKLNNEIYFFSKMNVLKDGFIQNPKKIY